MPGRGRGFFPGTCANQMLFLGRPAHDECARCTQTCRLHFAHFSSSPDTSVLECIVTPHLAPRAWAARRHLGAVLPCAQVILRLQMHPARAPSRRTLSGKNVKACGFHLPVLGLTCSQESANIFRRESDSKYFRLCGPDDIVTT